ncbi:MAG: polysaccharide biosynthesis/export family protein [Armatimonadetes bacterium]|nr:polysaccharide biosynthesis/export family protein [Armatimonadota bacterium]
MKTNAFWAAIIAVLPGMAWAQVSAPLGGGDAPAPVNTTPMTVPANVPTPVASGGADASFTSNLASYRLDTGDTVSITVDRHGDVSRNVTLMADATILLPRFGKPIMARGMTCAELSAAVFKALNTPDNFKLKPGQVTVALVAGRTRRVFVRGNAVRGGDFDLKNGWRVTELAAIMGGVPQPDRVTVSISNALRPAPITVDLASALASDVSPANILLMEGDTLIVNQPQNKVFFVKGEGPRGKQEVDERFTLKQALVQLGMSQNNASGELRKAKLYRHTVAGDVTSPTTTEEIDLVQILTDPQTDHDLKNFDTIDIPLSLRYYYVWGELGGARKRYLPEDRKTTLLDVMSDSVNTTPGQAKIGAIKILRGGDQEKTEVLTVDYGKFLSKGEKRHNPEILPNDVVIVPNVKRVDPINTIWTGFGLFNLAKSLLPGVF